MNSIAEEVTKLLLQKLEQGIVPWKRPWSLTGEGDARCGMRARRTPASTARGFGASPTAADTKAATG